MSQEEADPRFVPVVEALADLPGFSVMDSKSGATRGLMLDAKSFGMSSHGRLILKVGEQRATKLVAKGVAIPFSSSPGRTLKGWIEVTQADADWAALARAAYDAASSAPTRRRNRG